MKTSTIQSNGHVWHFIQTGGLVQLHFTSVDDVLELDKLDPKLWIALACPVKGLEFCEETLSLIDSDKNGRVHVPEILEAIAYIKKYFKRPEVIMTAGDTLPLDALGNEPFDCGHSPYDSALSVLDIVGKNGASEITLDDLSGQDKLFAPTVFNGDGVLPPDAAKDEVSAAVIKDIVACTGGSDDISGVKGITRDQFATFFKDVRAIKDWRESAQDKAQDIFFLKFETDAAAASFMKVRDKVNDYFLRCSIGSYNNDVAAALRKKEEEALAEETSLSIEQLLQLPLAVYSTNRVLPLGDQINPAWRADIDAFSKNVVQPLFGADKTSLSDAEWRKIEDAFTAYMGWYGSRPDTPANSLSFERIDEILSSDAETLIAAYLDEEEKKPPIALATLDLRKMLLYRRDFLELLKNFVSFENFYSPDELAIFQCGTLYIDGRSCDLCFKVIDSAKHATMSPLSQCYLLYCTCTRYSTGETMEIAAMVSAGNRDNLLVGRNGLFYDRKGQDWAATITKIVENPISIREAFWSPYKKLLRMIQERIAKTAEAAEASVTDKMSAAVEKPTEAASTAAATTTAKKIDVGTIAAISVAFTGIATVVGGLMQAFLGLGWWIPLGIVGIVLIISLPSMFIAWSKLRQRNVAPILDASGWAVNGNVKINIPLGALLTELGVRPKGSKLDGYDPYAQKGFPTKRVVLALVLLALIVGAVVIVAKSGWNIHAALNNVKQFFVRLVSQPAVAPVVEAAE